MIKLLQIILQLCRVVLMFALMSLAGIHRNTLSKMQYYQQPPFLALLQIFSAAQIPLRAAKQNLSEK